MNNEGRVPFSETWCFPSDLKTDLGASWFEVLPTPECYASGREKLICRFFGPGYGIARPIILERDAMELISKKTGKPYIVCRRKEVPQVVKGILKRPVTGSPLDASAFLDDEEAPPPMHALARTSSVAMK